MLKVYLVYESYGSVGDGLAGYTEWGDPVLKDAFTSKSKAQNWIRKQKKKYKGNWHYRFSYKTLQVS
jgi:hypothetical protein